MTKVVHPGGTLTPGPNGVKTFVNVGEGSEVWLIAILLPMDDFCHSTTNMHGGLMYKTVNPFKEQFDRFSIPLRKGSIDVNDGVCSLAALSRRHAEQVEGGWVKRIRLSSVGGGIGKDDLIISPLTVGDLVPLVDTSTTAQSPLFQLADSSPAATPYGVRFYEEYTWSSTPTTPSEVERPIFTKVAYESIRKNKELKNHPVCNLLSNVGKLKTTFCKQRKVGFFSTKRSKAEYWVTHDDFDKYGYVFRDNQDLRCKGAEQLSLLMKQEHTNVPNFTV
tara:strand:+ start:16638 stop:17468 length:831 start_codon:yes stop_codon:yes gene_type:complete